MKTLAPLRSSAGIAARREAAKSVASLGRMRNRNRDAPILITVRKKHPRKKY